MHGLIASANGTPERYSYDNAEAKHKTMATLL